MITVYYPSTFCSLQSPGSANLPANRFVHNADNMCRKNQLQKKVTEKDTLLHNLVMYLIYYTAAQHIHSDK